MSDVASLFADHEMVMLILVLALVTFATRLGGYFILARFKTIPGPVQAGLEAVPAAVITTLVVPPALNAGPSEMIALLVAVVASFRLQPILVVFLGLGVLILFRQMGL